MGIEFNWTLPEFFSVLSFGWQDNEYWDDYQYSLNIAIPFVCISLKFKKYPVEIESGKQIGEK